MAWLWGSSVQTATPTESSQASSPPPSSTDPSASTKQSPVDQTPSTSSSSTSPPVPITDDDLFDGDMSCSERFDRAFYCQALGGQFASVYRYGGLRDCSESWSDFWFCMRVKKDAADTRRRKTQQRFKERDKQRYKIGPSSEDVWKARTVKVDKAFDLDPDEAPVDD